MIHPFYQCMYFQGWYASRLALRWFFLSTAPDPASWDLPPAFLSISVVYKRALNRKKVKVRACALNRTPFGKIGAQPVSYGGRPRRLSTSEKDGRVLHRVHLWGGEQRRRRRNRGHTHSHVSLQLWAENRSLLHSAVICFSSVIAVVHSLVYNERAIWWTPLFRIHWDEDTLINRTHFTVQIPTLYNPTSEHSLIRTPHWSGHLTEWDILLVRTPHWLGCP